MRILGLSVLFTAIPSGIIGCDAGTTGGRLLGDAGAQGGNESVGGSSNNPTVGGSTANGTTTNANVGGGAPHTGGAPNVGQGGSPSTGGAGVPPATGGRLNAAGGAPATGGLASLGGGTSIDPAYYTSGSLHGYLWVSVQPTTTTISPADFSTHTPGAAYCISGTIAGTTDYSGLAMLGYNLNQAQGASTSTGTFTPPSISSGGVTVNISNNGTSPVRVQIQDPNGATSATDRWCAAVTTFNQSVLIPWSSFNTTCWTTGGVAYAGQPLEAAIMLIPGGLSSVAYNVCLNSIGAQ